MAADYYRKYGHLPMHHQQFDLQRPEQTDQEHVYHFKQQQMKQH